ncbi:MAG: AGE family epimerase/isomerase [Burkholderiales bacterium]
MLAIGCCVVLALLSSAGCNQQSGAEAHTRIDAEWHRHALVEGLLAHWLTAAPTASGFMRTAFDRRWVADSAQPGHLTDQARLVYAFIVGWEVTRDPRYLAAATQGADFLLKHFYDPVHGGFFLRVALDGTVLSSVKNTYGHAFALFALSHMARVTGEARYRAAALRTWSEIHTWLRDPQGGFRGEVARDFSSATGKDGYRSQNPVMHLFEALLALHDATQDPVALAGARSVANFVVYRLLVGLPDGGAYIPEWFDANWKPLTTREQGGYIDIGHQMEWSHMLMTAEQRGLGGVYAQTGERLLKFALAKGYDEADGGVFSRLYPDGTLDRDKYSWPQCEALRALLAAASRQNDLWRRYEQTLKLVREQFIDDTHGGWYGKACGKRGGCAEPQVEPYHMTGLHQMALSMATAGAK